MSIEEQLEKLLTNVYALTQLVEKRRYTPTDFVSELEKITLEVKLLNERMEAYGRDKGYG